MSASHSSGVVPPTPRVSVLLPVRNGAATIARALASIRGQTWADWELLVIDDGSTDATAAIVADFARGEPRLRLLRCPGAGLVAALNAGLAAATGEFVARLDADDEAHPERLAQQVAFLADPAPHDVGLVSCLVEFGGDRAAGAGYALHVDWVNSLVTSEAMALERFVEAPVAHPSVMFRRELIERHGGYRAGEFPEDYELWLRWMDAGVRFAKVPRVLLRWNDPPDRLSRRDERYSPDAFFRLKAEWIARWLTTERIAGSADETSVRRIFVWGAGRHTRQRAAHLARHGVSIDGYIDVDPKKATAALGGTGVPVLLPTQLPPPGELFVLGYVSLRGARDHIRGELQRRSYVEGRDFLMCA